MEEFIVGPITASYPNGCITTVEQNEPSPTGWATWTAELELDPEPFPILRHSQIEAMLNQNFADPISDILRASRPYDQLQCCIEIIISPAKPQCCHQATYVVMRLDREFFHHHHRLARYYARHITRLHDWLLAWMLGIVAWKSQEATRTTLETSTRRQHDSEDDLQASSGKVGGHLLESQILLIVLAPVERRFAASDFLRVAKFGFSNRNQLPA